ncbi:UNVERIFIED_CONTAM: Adenylate isopentenyltransferase 5, chloroplastic [Sesamum radiatum]|uniref:Adenylate isopentenyltransferase 5, chloroplastic n=1 Tax=Sesamum radiatum TaxID=300843 RepID=A0AAW2QIG5_SESRA
MSISTWKPAQSSLTNFSVRGMINKHQGKDKVYKGLDIVTNKVSNEECRGVPHHLLGIIDPEVDFTVHDFVHHALLAVDAIVQKNRLPIIAGGSNSFIQALVNDDTEFCSKYQCCFLWMDVAIPVLHSYVSKRVDQMVDSGLVEEDEGGIRVAYMNATEVFLRRGGDAEDAWERLVLEPSTNIVARFVCKGNIDPEPTIATPSNAIPIATTIN